MSRIDRFDQLTKDERRTLSSLRTPERVQDFVNAIPQNFETNGGTCMSVRETLIRNRAHCIEGALVAALAFFINGERPLLLDLEANDEDEDHVVALFRRDGLWGAISKGNHAYVRYRDPIYRTVRELAMSYVHEYYNQKGNKTLRRYSRPYDLSRVPLSEWATGIDAWRVANDLCTIRHYLFMPAAASRRLRPVDPIQLEITKHKTYYD